MACAAMGDEIFFHIASQNASRLNVMDMEIFGTSASLASSHRAGALAGKARDRNPGPSEACVVLGRENSRRLRYPQQELQPL